MNNLTVKHIPSGNKTLILNDSDSALKKAIQYIQTIHQKKQHTFQNNVNTPASIGYKKIFYFFRNLLTLHINLKAPKTNFFILDLFVDSTNVNIYQDITTAPENTGIFFKTSSKTLQIKENDNFNRAYALEENIKQTTNDTCKIYLTDSTMLIETDNANHDLHMETFYTILYFYVTYFKNCFTFPDEVIKFIEGFYKSDINLINQTINEVIYNAKFRKIQMESLKDAFKDNKENRIADLNNTLTRSYSEKQNSLSYLADIERNIKMVQEELELWYNKPNKLNKEEIIEHLIKNPYLISAEQFYSGIITLNFEGPLIYYDKVTLQTMCNNTTDPEREIFYKTLLSDKYELWVKTALDWKTEKFLVVPIETTNGPLIKHPHINRYNCLGNHPDEIESWIRNNDYIGCLDQITYAVLELNVTDGVVMRELEITLEAHEYEYSTFRNKETGEMCTYAQVKEDIANETDSVD